MLRAQHRNELDPQSFVEQFVAFEFKPNRDEERFRRLAADLSSRLPKVSDSSLFEIDDIIYGEGDIVAGTNISSEETIKYLVEKCFATIYSAYFNRHDFGRDVEMAYLQLLELSSSEHVFEDETLERISFYIFPKSFPERYMKAFKILSTKHRSAVDKTLFKKLLNDDKSNYLVAFLALLNSPGNYKCGHPNEKRRAEWLSQQSMLIIEALDLNKFDLHPSLTQYLQTRTFLNEECYNSEFVWLVLSCVGRGKMDDLDFYSNHLHNYFFSLRNETEKLHRIKHFITGVFLTLIPFADIENQSQTLDDHKNMLRYLRSFMEYSEKIIEHNVCKLISIEEYPTTYMMKLDRQYGYVIESYLTNIRGGKCSPYMTFKAETTIFVDKYFGNNSKAKETLESFPYDEKKVSRYHEFMKSLQLLDALHSVWLMVDDIIGKNNIYSDYMAYIFRPCKSLIKKSITEFINDSSCRGRVHWLIQAVLKHCPFLILSYENELWMESLIKMLSGRSIDNASKEMLHYLINSNRYFHSDWVLIGQ